MKNAIFAITLAVALPAWGKDDNPFVTGNQFLETCQKPSNLAGCLGYVRGIHDFIRLTDDKKTFCFPEALTGQQTLDMLLEDLKTRPDERHYPIVNIYQALMWANFSCSFGLRRELL